MIKINGVSVKACCEIRQIKRVPPQGNPFYLVFIFVAVDPLRFRVFSKCLQFTFRKKMTEVIRSR